MEEEKTEAIRVDGVVVTIPRERIAYLIAKTPLGLPKIEPFEKVPVEERVVKFLEEAGKKISELLEKRKAKEIKEVV